MSTRTNQDWRTGYADACEEATKVMNDLAKALANMLPPKHTWEAHVKWRKQMKARRLGR